MEKMKNKKKNNKYCFGWATWAASGRQLVTLWQQTTCTIDARSFTTIFLGHMDIIVFIFYYMIFIV